MIELGKKYQTRDGRAVRILCVDGPGEQPVVGIVETMVGTWNLNGVYFLHPMNEGDRHLMERFDLFPVPTKHRGWGIVDKRGKLVASFNGEYAREEAYLQAEVFAGDKVVCLTWES